MASVPGNVGLPLVSDKSVDFYKDAVQFVDRKIQELRSRIFASRFLNKHTVFIASNDGVLELLNDKAKCTELGYKSFMHEIFGDNILFTDGEQAKEYRTLIWHIISTENTLRDVDLILTSVNGKYIDCLGAREQVLVYSMFKKLATEISLTTFLSLDFEQSAEIADKIVNLTTTHWHGIISVPINVKLPLMNKSTYGKALDAKQKLLEIIHDKLSGCTTGIPKCVKDSDFGSFAAGPNHVLLFTSAIVPKAIASILTSFVITIANKKHYINEAKENPDFLEHLLLEVMRMYPPLFGGRRVAKEDFTIDGKNIRSGQAIVYLTRHAQRDPSVFDSPDEFDPSRWTNKNAGDRDKLFVLGSGSRDCVGKHMVWKILKTVTRTLLEKYTWEICENQDLRYKWLPVSRPREDIFCTFSQVGCNNSLNSGMACLDTENISVTCDDASLQE